MHDRSSGGLSPRRLEVPQLEKLEPLSKGVLPLLEPPPRLRTSQGTNLLSQPRQPVKSLGPWRPPFPRVPPLVVDTPPPATPVQMYLIRPLSPSRKLMASDPAAAVQPEGLDPPEVLPVGIVWQGVSGRRRERLRAAIPRTELRAAAPSAKSRAKLDAEGESIWSSEAEGTDAETRPSPRRSARPRARSEAEAEAAGFLCWAGAGFLPVPSAAERLLARCVGTEAYHRCVGTPAELRQGAGRGGRNGAGSPRRAKSGAESPPGAGADGGADGSAEAEARTWQTQKVIVTLTSTLALPPSLP